MVEVGTSNLTTGNTKSCGCLKADLTRERGADRRSGIVGTPTYSSWICMRRRCLSADADQYPIYGGRGIQVDPRWDSYAQFLADMGERPAGTSLDRIDPNAHYSPENCRWAEPRTQANNRRNNRFLSHDGRTQTIAEWAREAGLPRGVLYNRLFILNWPVERALTQARS